MARQAVRAAHRVGREELTAPLMIALGRAELTEDAAEALARLGEAVVTPLSQALRSDDVPVEVRRELPSVLLRIGSAEAEQALVSSLLEADGTVRHRVIASLNKLRAVRPDIHIDRERARTAAGGGDCRTLPVVSGARTAPGSAQRR